MAGVMTHMIVAREINKRLPEGTITNMGLFYLGNLAPDAIHAREGYIRDFKKHTHFREDIKDSEFAQEENRNLFHKRLMNFIKEHCDNTDELHDLYRGFVTHNLTDELYVLTVREEFCRIMEKQGISQSSPQFFEYVVADMTRNDILLTHNYEGIDEIRICLEQVPVYPVEGYLTAKEMNICKDWLIFQHFYKKNEVLQPRYISYERTMEFIAMAADDIVKRLSEDICFPKMF